MEKYILQLGELTWSRVVVFGMAALAAYLEREAQALARRLGVAHLELRNVRRRHADWPLQDLYVQFRNDLAPDVEANMQAIPRKQRCDGPQGNQERLAQ